MTIQTAIQLPDDVFERVKGVISVESGYSGGTKVSADYDSVSAGITGHAESVRIRYNPAVVSYNDLLHIFFSVTHDPTQLNRQGPDTGTQYRNAIVPQIADHADERKQQRHRYNNIESVTAH